MITRDENTKMQVKFGGRRKLKKSGRRIQPSYGGVRVTDGGDLIPLDIDNNGYGLYMAYGDNHEQYHRSPSGKYKTGVGLKLPNGEDLEVEGSKTGRGEIVNIQPDEVTAFSKHNVGDFVPADAVLAGVPPEQVAMKQEFNKTILGLNDDGTMAKCGKRKKLKALAGANILMNDASIPVNINPAILAVGALKDNTSPVAKCGKRVSLRHKAGLGTDWKNYWGNFSNWGGAAINAAGNLGAGLISGIGSFINGNRMAKAYEKGANVLKGYIEQMHGIDAKEAGITRENYDTGTAIAAVSDPMAIRFNAQRNRIDRNREAEIRAVNKSNLSSASRANKLASINDRYGLRFNENAENEHNARAQVWNENMNRITNVSATNAQLKAQAAQQYTDALMRANMFNAEIDNMKLGMIGQAESDAITQGAFAKANGLQSGLNALGSGLAHSANAFSTSYNDYTAYNRNWANDYVGYGNETQTNAAIMKAEREGDYSYIKDKYLASLGDDEVSVATRKKIEDWARKNNKKFDWLNAGYTGFNGTLSGPNTRASIVIPNSISKIN